MLDKIILIVVSCIDVVTFECIVSIIKVNYDDNINCFCTLKCVTPLIRRRLWPGIEVAPNRMVVYGRESSPLRCVKVHSTINNAFSYYSAVTVSTCLGQHDTRQV